MKDALNLLPLCCRLKNAAQLIEICCIHAARCCLLPSCRLCKPHPLGHTSISWKKFALTPTFEQHSRVNSIDRNKRLTSRQGNKQSHGKAAGYEDPSNSHFHEKWLFLHWVLQFNKFIEFCVYCISFQWIFNNKNLKKAFRSKAFFFKLWF